jgi:hypothetical protein
VLPGNYTVRLTVGGQTMTQPLAVKMDPRVRTPAAGLKAQFDAARAIDALLTKDFDALTAARQQGESAAKSAQELQRLNRALTQLLGIVESADAAPTSQTLAAIKETQSALDTALAELSTVRR